MRQPTADERADLERLMKRRGHDERTKAIAIIHALNGRTTAEIAVAVGRTTATVANWLRQWEAGKL